MKETIAEALRAYQTTNDVDVWAYCGSIERSGYEELCTLFEENDSPRTNATLVLCTYGGDPHAAFRIARALSHRYPNGKISTLVPAWCKSAGTLICIGSNQLILCDAAELGPLDVQVQKPDEMIGRISGLDILRGMESLKEGLLGSFRQFLIDINTGTGISTKAAADVATKLAVGIYEPILGQIDPMRLGEMEAALQIAFEYGRRLDARFQNLKAHALLRLVHAYPSHSFVIDRKEAKSLFHRVRPADRVESIIAEMMLSKLWKPDHPERVEVAMLDAIIDEFCPKSTTSSSEGKDHDLPTRSADESDPDTQLPRPGVESIAGAPAENEHDAASGQDNPGTAPANQAAA